MKTYHLYKRTQSKWVEAETIKAKSRRHAVSQWVISQVVRYPGGNWAVRESGEMPA